MDPQQHTLGATPMGTMTDPGTTSPGTTSPRTRRPSGALMLVAVAVAALLLVAVAALQASTSTRAEFPQDSPAGVFQAYLAACLDDDLVAAYDFFSARVRRQMTFDEFERASTYWGPDQLDGRQIVLDGVVERGDRATLRIRDMHRGDAGLLGRDTHDRELEVRLVREREAWRIDMALVGIDPLDWW